MKIFSPLLLAILVFFTLSISLGNPVFAEEPVLPLHTARLYGVYWQNIHVGDIIGEIKEDGNQTELRVHMRALSILKTLTRYQNKSVSTARPDKVRGFLPVAFEVQSVLRKKTKTAQLHYGEDGEIAEEIVDHPANPRKVKPVEASMKKGSVDPLTAALIAREQVRRYRDAKGKNYFSLNVYDGRQLFELHFTIGEPTTFIRDGHPISVIPLHFARKPLAGFGAEELKRMEKQDPVIDLYVSNDTLLLPVEAEGRAVLGKANAVLRDECGSLAECVLGE